MLPLLDGRAWEGTAYAYGTQFLVELFESQRHPGYYYLLVACVRDDSFQELDRPVKATAIEGFLRTVLARDHGLLLEDFQWEEKERFELLFSAFRILAGD